MPTEAQTPPPKEVKLQIRLDAELADRVNVKARRFGGASAVIRALLRRWVEQDIVSADEVLAESNRAPQAARKKPGPRHPPAHRKQ